MKRLKNDPITIVNQKSQDPNISSWFHNFIIPGLVATTVGLLVYAWTTSTTIDGNETNECSKVLQFFVFNSP